MNTTRRNSNYIAKKVEEKNLDQRPNKLENKLIENYLSKKNVAPWFRGTSHYHILGTDRLFNALRDDAEQRTTHRVRSCLNLIGLEPMITSKQITFLMRLSRCNDLIFLWFLMEMHYKTPKPGPFSVNEQLICSAICHLDMITTLRELDKILPSGHTSKIDVSKAEIERTQKKEQIKAKKVSKNVLPYFDAYPRPKHYGKRLTLKVPNFKVQFNMYQAYNDPNYYVQNETNRWFACYEFNTGKRVVHSLIREILEGIFCCLESDPCRFRSTDILCNYHKNIKNMQTILKYEKIVQARNNCLNKYFKTDIDQQNRAECCRKLLNDAIEKELYKFKQHKQSIQKNGMTLKNITSDLKMFDVVMGEEPDCYSKSALEPKVCKSEAIQHYNMNNANYTVQKNAKNKDSENFNRSNFDFHYINDTSNPSEVLFRCPAKNKPYFFDYRKIFLPTCTDDDKRYIQNMCLTALGSKISNHSNVPSKDNIKYDQAVTECANTIFENAVQQYEESIKDYLATQAAENLKPLSQYPTSANYNAEDHTLMDQMLYDAFQYLRKNPKFVWAQLPDAHKVPMLREWIARRYGKEYSPKKRSSSYRKSCKIFRALGKNQIDLPVPTSNKIGRNHFLNYDCRNYLDKKVKYIKNRYHYDLDSSFLEHTRIFWFAMRGYLCAIGPPRKTFFAYMPSKYRDIQHFRLWKSSEYRNYKVFRNDRHSLK